MSLKDLQQTINLFELPQLTAGITSENDNHIPSPGCHKLAYLKIKDEVTSHYSISLGIEERFIYQAVGQALYQHELFKTFKKYQIRKEDLTSS